MAPSRNKSKRPARRDSQRLLNHTRRKLSQKYELLYKIGHGGFSEVYMGVDRANKQKKYAIKVNYSTASVQRSLEQFQWMVKMDGEPGFPKLVDAFIEDSHFYIVQQYYYSQSFKRILKTANLNDAKHYLLELLKALKILKDKKIIHRDIKPLNFLYNMRTKKGVLIDFGLASKESNKEVAPYLKETVCGTRQYTPLQLFFDIPNTYASDIWSVGVIMLQLMTKKMNTFATCNGVASNFHYLVTLILELAVFSKRKVIQQCHEWGYQLILPRNIRHNSFSQICIMQGYDRVAEDLLKRMLDINPLTRITVQQAIEHPFFESIKPAPPKLFRTARKTVAK